jgi:hypothetical protein
MNILTTFGIPSPDKAAVWYWLMYTQSSVDVYAFSKNGSNTFAYTLVYAPQTFNSDFIYAESIKYPSVATLHMFLLKPSFSEYKEHDTFLDMISGMSAAGVNVKLLELMLEAYI